jgi:hypothetical protein
MFVKCSTVVMLLDVDIFDNVKKCATFVYDNMIYVTNVHVRVLRLSENAQQCNNFVCWHLLDGQIGAMQSRIL